MIIRFIFRFVSLSLISWFNSSIIIENYKENKENVEINDNKSIYFIKRSKVNSKVKRIKFPPSNKIYNSKTNSKSKYIFLL